MSVDPDVLRDALARLRDWASIESVPAQDEFDVILSDLERLVGGEAEDAAESVARHFHSVYEALAPYEGYRTRDSSAVPWDAVPDANKRLMVRTVETLLRADIIRQGENRG